MAEDSEYPTAHQPSKRLLSSRILRGLAVWMVIQSFGVATLLIASGKPVTRAVGLMAGGTALLWNVIGGFLMYRYRNPIRTYVRGLPYSWPVKFVVFCTLLAMAEEAITTTMTNLAPVFGVKVGQAYITASANYLDVISLHSVIVFIPMFICWAWILSRYDFHPNAVFLIFAVTGTLAEISFGGPTAIVAFGFWSYIYGLMIYLPAYCLPNRPSLRKPVWWRYPLMALLPILCVAPVAVVISVLHPIKIHFPPMR
jgi:hypothetical protein